MVTKCKNCGANLDTDDNAQFCPYCGLKIEKPKDPHDFDKWKLNHEEDVRLKKEEERKKSMLIAGIAFVVILALLMLMSIFQK